MNQISIKEIQTTYGYKQYEWIIDGEVLYDYFNMWANESQDSYYKSLEPFDELCPTWCKELDLFGKNNKILIISYSTINLIKK